jgi:hypothetical protein
MLDLKKAIKDSQLYIDIDEYDDKFLIQLSFTKEVTDDLEKFKKIFNDNKKFLIKVYFIELIDRSDYLLKGCLLVNLGDKEEALKLSEEIENNKNIYIEDFIHCFNKNRSKIDKNRIKIKKIEDILEDTNFEKVYTEILFFSKYIKLGKAENVKKIVSEELISQVANQEVKLNKKKDDLIIRALIDKDKAKLSEELRNMIEVENGKITDYSRELFELNFKR